MLSQREEVLYYAAVKWRVVYWMSTGTARISQTSTSLVSQTFSVPAQRRSLSVCGTQREGSILKAIDAAERKGSGLRDYHWVGCNTVEFSYAGSAFSL